MEKTRGGRPSTTDNPFRLIERHFPSHIPPTEKIMPPIGVLFVENVESEKNSYFITKLKYFKCYG